VRAGQTEASSIWPAWPDWFRGRDLRIMNEDGTMARVPDLVQYCAQHNLKMLTVADLIRYRCSMSATSGAPAKPCSPPVTENFA